MVIMSGSKARKIDPKWRLGHFQFAGHVVNAKYNLVPLAM